MGCMASKNCSICLEKKKESEFKITSQKCKHNDICKQCVKEYILALKPDYDKIVCPVHLCKNNLNYEEIKYFLKDDMSIWEEKAVRNQIERMIRKNKSKNETIMYCANGGCGNIQIIEGGGRINSFFKCHQCGTLTCMHHSVVMHIGRTCEEYDQDKKIENERNEELLKNTKKCPKCTFTIEKVDDACDRVQCIYCNYRFCWVCTADYEAILENGNHYHSQECDHYRPYKS